MTTFPVKNPGLVHKNREKIKIFIFDYFSIFIFRSNTYRHSDYKTGPFFSVSVILNAQRHFKVLVKTRLKPRTPRACCELL